MSNHNNSHGPLPLSGVRVLELAEGWAGPMTGMWLGDLGAEVIKVEAIQRYDHARGPVVAPEGLTSYPNGQGGPRPYDVMSAYIQGNRNKRAITIDLARPKGVELFKGLVRISDVVITNMVTGVPEKMGIGYSELSKARSDLIMLISSGYGASGPYSRRVTMGGAMDGIAGYTWLRHYADQTPDTTNYTAHTDVVTSQNNAMAVLMAIYRRNRTGKGQLVETAGVEACLHQIPAALMDFALNGRVHASPGNDHPTMAPHGCYPCRGDDRWIVISVYAEGQWQALRQDMGDPAWAQDERFATALSRWANRGALNEHMAEWTRHYDHNDLMDHLQSLRIPAAAVHDNKDHAEDRHWRERGIYEDVELEGYGTYRVPASPWVMDGRRLGIRRPPPRFAQHNKEVLSDLLGLTTDELSALQAEQYIGDAPLMHEI